ncbi:MAG: tetratricopeptide repeat protein [Spirochaetaceae bacterium]
MSPRGHSALLILLLSLTAFPARGADFEELTRRLRSEPDSPVVGELLVEAIGAAPTLREAREVYSLYGDALSTDRQRVAVYRELGALEELAGNFVTALRNYEELLRIDPEDDEVRLRAAAAAMETGNYERVRRHSQYVIDSARDREKQRLAGLFLALSHYHEDNRSEGLPLFESLTRGESRRTLESRTLVFALLAARAWEAESLAAELEEKLEELYPATLDRLALREGGVVSLAPRPSILLPATSWDSLPLPEREEGTQPPADAAQSERPQREAERESPSSLVIGIQTGSFSDKENAEVMRDEIRKEGLPAQVRETKLEEQRYYRVVVPTEEPVPPEEAQELVVRLKELGVEGFLLFDEEANAEE